MLHSPLPCTGGKPGGDTPDVFISYRRNTGSQLASLLKVHLQLHGFSVFIDVEKLEAGKFKDKLIQSIMEARNFVLVLSAGALDRCMQDDGCKDWVHKSQVGEILACYKNMKNRKSIKGWKIRDFMEEAELEESKEFMSVEEKASEAGKQHEQKTKEIATALKYRKNIVPVIDSFEWPEPQALPEDMQAVLNFNAIKWSHEYQEATIEKIIRFLQGRSSRDSSAGSDTSLEGTAPPGPHLTSP